VAIPSRTSAFAPGPGAAGGAISGRDVNPLGPSDPLPMSTRPPFVLVHYPDQYEHVQVDGRWVVVPALVRFDIVPGVEHVEPAMAGRPNLDRTRAAFAAIYSKGGIILDADANPVTARDHLPPGVSPGRYQRALPVRDRVAGIEGERWHEVWEVYELTRAGTVRTSYDVPARARWLMSLMDAGVLERPPADIVEAIIGTAAQALTRVRSDARIMPDQRAERVQSMEAALARLRADLTGPAPEPTPVAAPPAPPVPSRRRASEAPAASLPAAPEAP
jgi:hypothetical protein